VKRVRYPRLVLLAVFAVAAAACHSGEDVNDSGGSSLTAALASVAGTDNTRLYFEWADLARIRDLAAVTKDKPTGTSDVDHRRWGTLFGTGTGSLAPVAPQLADTIDLFGARTAVLIGQPLSADAGVAAAASCLGGVLTATIAPGGKSHLAGVQTVAVGVRDPAKGSDPAVEELCLVAPDKAAADALESRVRQHATTSAVSQVTSQPWSALVTSITVTRAGDTAVRVELTNRPERAANLLRAALQNQDLLSLTG
jgi:hypothetical protein